MESNKRKKDVPVPDADASTGPGPVKVIRLDDVSVSVFRRDPIIDGQPVTYYSVSFSRSYKDESGSRKYTKNFDPEDLGKVMALAKQASEFIEAENLQQAIGAS